MLASLVKGLCFQPHSPGRKPYLSRAKRVSPGSCLGGVRREVSLLLFDPEGDYPAWLVEPPVRKDVAEAEEDAAIGNGHAAVRAADEFCGERCSISERVGGKGVQVGVGRRLEIDN